MMTMLSVEPIQESGEVLCLVRTAIENDTAKLELALGLARKCPAPFEKKHGVASECFIAEMTAENLENGDDEYVCWAGEYKLMRWLGEKLDRLREIRYRWKRLSEFRLRLLMMLWQRLS